MRKDGFWYLKHLELQISKPLLLESMRVLKLFYDKKLTIRRKARCLAGTAIYLAQLTCPDKPKDEHYTQKQISSMVGASEASIKTNSQYFTNSLWYFYQYRRS
jgi:transcription initiation factor TFIIIB Brf1 subunit/transcription initiation factor TFIIB